jgi:hypothetical protein
MSDAEDVFDGHVASPKLVCTAARQPDAIPRRNRNKQSLDMKNELDCQLRFLRLLL